MPPIPPDVDMPPAAIPLKSFIDNYLVIGKLGSGSFGTVILAKYKHLKDDLLVPSAAKKGTLLHPLSQGCLHANNLVAVKTMNSRLSTLRDYTHVKEIKFILAIPSHPNLVQVFELFVDNINYQLHIVMESLSQNLYQLIKARKRHHFLPVTLKSVLSQILAGIRHIHQHDYFHRDVKPENILVIPSSVYYGSKEAIPLNRRYHNYIVKLADYGLARHVNNTKPYTAYVSTRWYRSPEILLRKNWYSRPADMWAFGCVAVEVAKFYPLFPGTNEIDQTWRILKMLGSPSVAENSHPRNTTGKPPFGGFWEEGQTLASRLGFTLPYVSTTELSDILPDQTLGELAEVVASCLTWDPSLRADVNKVCSMAYFAGTDVSRENQKHSSMAATLPHRVSENVVDSIVEVLSEGLENHGKLVSSNKMEKQQPNPAFQNIHKDVSIYDNFDDGYENDFMGGAYGNDDDETGGSTKDEIEEVEGEAEEEAQEEAEEEEEDLCNYYDPQGDFDAFEGFSEVQVCEDFDSLPQTDFNDGTTEYDSEGAHNVGSRRNVYNWDTNTSHYDDTPRDMKEAACDNGGKNLELVPQDGVIVSHGT